MCKSGCGYARFLICTYADNGRLLVSGSLKDSKLTSEQQRIRATEGLLRWRWRCDLLLWQPLSNKFPWREGRFVAVAAAVAHEFVAAAVAVALPFVVVAYVVVKLRRGGVPAFIQCSTKW
jgi:hypothetical protein